MPAAPTLLTPYGYSSGTCGYCTASGTRSKKKSSSKYGMVTEQMTPRFYQDLVDRGWRRSGDYVYHPDMARTCCPQYTIRLDAINFKPEKKHRQVVNRFNRYIETGLKPGETAEQGPHENQAQGSGAGSQAVLDGSKGGGSFGKKPKGKSREHAISLDPVEALHAFEMGFGGDSRTAVHRFETQLVPAKSTKETFDLYKRYQIAIHKDPPGDVSMRGYERFLCSKTLVETPIVYAEGEKTDHLPGTYGAYHLYSRLVGISVIDILPSCVSSVYFIWDPEYAWASLGKVSALYELGLVRRMAQAGAQGMGWLYMGYWIPDCQKMRYKSDYAPSYLLDPGTNVFHPLDSKLDAYLTAHPRGYRPFEEIGKQTTATRVSANPNGDEGTEAKTNNDGIPPEDDDLSEVEEDEEEEEEEEEEIPSSWPAPAPPSFAEPSSFAEDQIDSLLVLMSKGSFLSKRQVFQVGDLSFRNEQSVKSEIREFLAAVGAEYVASADNAEPGVGMDRKAILYFG